MVMLKRVDKNGTKYFQVACSSCGGVGYISVYNHVDGGICYRCKGKGTVTHKEYTPEYRAKLDLRNAINREKRASENESKRLSALNKWRRENPEKVKIYEDNLKNALRNKLEREKKAKNQEFVGEVGERSNFTVEKVVTHSFETQWGKTFIHVFKDKEENLLVWKTQSFLDCQIGDFITIKATVKDHQVYQEGKQTLITRVKVIQ